MKDRSNGRIVIGCSAIIIIFIEVIWAYLWKFTEIIPSIVGSTFNLDMVYYVSSILIAFVLFPVLMCLFGRMHCPFCEDNENKKREIILFSGSMALMLLALGSIFLFEKKQTYVGVAYLPWHDNRLRQYAVFILTFCVIVFVYYCFKKCKYKRVGKIFSLFGTIFSAWAAWGVYQPNFFNDLYDVVHVNAYFNSIYRVLYLQPFTELNGGVYGFYGIIIAPLVKLFGGDAVACIISLAVLTALSMACYYYVLDYLVDLFWVKFAAGVAALMGTVAVISEIRVQRFPHRVIFAGFVLAFIVFKVKHTINSKVFDCIGILLVVLSLVWNIESGMGCLVAWMGYKIVECLQEHKLCELVTWKCIAGQICVAVASLIGAFCFVGIYNLVVAGEFITIEAFFFPLVGSSMINALNVEMLTIPSAWMLVLLLYFIAIFFVLLNTKFCGVGTNHKTGVFASVVIVSCIQMTYYVNRSDYVYLYTILPTIVIVMAYFIDYIISKGAFSSNFLGNGFLRAFAVINMTVLILLSLATIVSFKEVDSRKNINRDMTVPNEFMEFVKTNIPQEAIGYGAGITEIYSMLGWDTGYYGMDVAEIRFMSDENKQQVCDWLNGVGDIFVNNESIEKWIIPYVDEGMIDEFFNTHSVEKTYQINNQSYTYYRCK